MKKLTALLAVSTAVLTMNLSVASAEIRLGLDSAPYPPFAEKGADGVQSGFEIELGEAICAAMGETLSGHLLPGTESFRRFSKRK